MANDESIRAVICENLNRLLQERRMTQKELADHMHVSASTVNDWVKGKKIPRMDKIDKICSIFRVQREEVLYDSSRSHSTRADGLPTLSQREERDIERDLEDMMQSVASANFATKGAAEDNEALKAALRVAMISAKRAAKKKYTPRKYRK